MVIAVLVLLGVSLGVIVLLVAIVLVRRRWLLRQPGAFVGVVRVTSGEVDGLSPTWKRGIGRWVRDVLVLSKPPFHFRQALVPVDRSVGQRQADVREVKRLGDDPVVLAFASGDASIEIAVHPEHRGLAAGFVTASVGSRASVDEPAPER